MSINKLALIRYKAIDECLKNRFRKWTLEDLIDKVSDVLYEYEGIQDGVSKRTIQGDIQIMRSDKLGYNAPIVVLDRKYYTYEDPDYSITNTPINEVDIEKMKEIVAILKQFSGFSYFEDMTSMIVRLENNLYTSSKQTKNHIQFEGNHRLKGIHHIDPIYQSILRKKPLMLTYLSFKARSAVQNIYYPYLLKEYRNRWFLIAKAKDTAHLLTLALDRIVEFRELSLETYVECVDIDFDTYYNDVIGVTKTEKNIAQIVQLHVAPSHAPYILTKPIHASQKTISQDPDGLTIEIKVVLNFELERELLGFGEEIKVLSPRMLVQRIKKRLQRSLAKYT